MSISCAFVVSRMCIKDKHEEYHHVQRDEVEEEKTSCMPVCQEEVRRL